MSLLPEQAQAEVFAERPYALAPATFSPGGSATTVDGGYQLSGKWSWASGVMHGNWAMVAGMVSDGGRPDYRLFLLPIEDVQIDDVWFMSGMKGTGSNDIVVTDRFVPAYRTVSFLSILDGTAPGALLHDAPLYRWPLVPMLALGAAAPALGTAESTVERFRLRVTERVMAYSGGAVQRDRPAAQMQLGRSAADVIAARSIYDGAIQQLEQILDHGGSLDAAQRSRYRLIAAHVVFLARKVVSELCAASGGSAHRLDSPFQRAMRDVNTMAGHVVFDYDATTELYGRVQVGLDVPTGTLV
ncbi:MAG: acyl-CoA dehydrogenase, partial [Ilumatobacteraceae bacterium]